LFVQAGLTPMEALQTATINAAKFLTPTPDLGTSASVVEFRRDVTLFSPLPGWT
jgi:adenine deaminase